MFGAGSLLGERRDGTKVVRARMPGFGDKLQVSQVRSVLVTCSSLTLQLGESRLPSKIEAGVQETLV
jgi:hypothetical protein